MHEALRSIAWERPWLAPYRELGEAAQQATAAGASLVPVLNALRCAAAPQFVPAHEQGTQAYETFIAHTGQVPTRDNLHDFFNALVWLRFPALKRRLNALHAAEIARDGVTDRRGAVRDALTLFDENGALLCAPPALTEPLRRREWSELFVAGRGLWSEAQLVIVGHALLEKLVQPRKASTAHVWFAPQSWGAGADDAVPDVDPCSPADAPLPVLGVPHWWPANQAPEFYADPAVFRPAENLRSTNSARRCRS
jgi:hypothetical protein